MTLEEQAQIFALEMAKLQAENRKLYKLLNEATFLLDDNSSIEHEFILRANAVLYPETIKYKEESSL